MQVLFVTGAGISANSGIPTYRAGGSSWRDAELEKKSHASRYGMHLDELWNKHWGPLSVTMQNAQPTHTHKAITAFQQSNPSIIATQNIDGLHKRAGSDNVAELHGSMTVRCMRCKQDNLDVQWTKNTPVCPNCGLAKTRPDVVLFGEKLNQRLFSGIQSFARNDADVIIAIGTSLNVFPAAGLVMDNVDYKKIIIINKDRTPFDKFAHTVMHDDCDEVIDEVLSAL